MKQPLRYLPGMDAHFESKAKSELTPLEYVKQTCREQNRPARVYKPSLDKWVYINYKCPKCYDNGFIAVVKHNKDYENMGIDDGYYVSWVECDCKKRRRKNEQRNNETDQSD